MRKIPVCLWLCRKLRSDGAINENLTSTLRQDVKYQLFLTKLVLTCGSSLSAILVLLHLKYKVDR